MAKRFFDIFPPGAERPPGAEKPPGGDIFSSSAERSSQKLNDFQEAEYPRGIEDFKEQEPATEKKQEMPDFKTFKKTVFLTIFLLIVGGGTIFCYLYFPRVSLELWLKTAKLDFKETAKVEKGVKELDPERLLLPGKIVVEETILSDEFSATGKALVERRAEGQARIFNDYSTASQPLLANTRLVSSEGKLFRLIERTVVPGQVLEGGKLSPGTIDVKVRADAPGEEYNINSTTFSIPGFAGTAKFTSFYAKSFSQMKGGFSGEISVLSLQDLEKAKKIMAGRAEISIQESLKNRVLAGLVLVEKGASLEIIEFGSETKAGEEVKNFRYQIKAAKSAVLLAEEDLQELARQSSFKRLETGQKSLAESIKGDPTIELINEAAGTAKIILQVSGKIYQDLNKESLEERIKGKAISEVEKDFENLAQVSRARIKIFPSFVKKMPEDLNKVKIVLLFE